MTTTEFCAGMQLVHEHGHSYVENGLNKYELVRIYEIPDRPDDSRVVEVTVWTFSCRGALVDTHALNRREAPAD